MNLSTIRLTMLISFFLVLMASQISAQTPTPLEKLPYSGSLLAARAMAAGKLQPKQANVTANGADLTCSPGPCVFPTSTASLGGNVFPVNTTPIVLPPLSKTTLLTGANDYNCPNLQGFYMSTNTGISWNHSCMNAAPGGVGIGSPSVAIDTHGTAYASGIDELSTGSTEVVVQKSTNNGASWGSATVAVAPLFSGGIVDKEWLQVDPNNSSPFLNCLYISSTQFDTSNNSTITVAHSCNGGATWTNVQVDSLQTFPAVDQFSDLAIGFGGTVYLSWMRCPGTGKAGDCGGTQATMLFSQSSDGGNTWSTPTVTARVRLVPDTCGAYFGCLPNSSEPLSNIPVIDTDNSTREHRGYLYVAMYTYSATARQLQVQVVTSSNGGSTWGAPVKVSGTTINDQFLPWLTVNSVGKVGVSWLDRRNDTSNVSYQTFVTDCHNGGVSFGTNYQLTSTLSNPNNDGFGGFFMGDYTGNFFQGPSLFTSWMDSSNGSIMQDVVGGFVVE